MTTATQADKRTDSMKIEMADHFQEFEAEYRTEPQHREIVHEDDEVIVVADHSNHELHEWADEFGMSLYDLSEIMHTLARQKCDYNWSVSDPVVFDKPEE